MKEFKPTPIEYSQQRVLTTAQLAEAYKTTTKTITDNFNNNKSRYIEGVHYFCLTGAELKAFKNYTENFGVVNKRTPCLYLWTERGALLHAKSLNTDKAWEVYEFLVDTYFRVREISKLYNEDIYHKLEVLEQKLEMSEKRNVMIYQKLEMSEKRNVIIYQKLEMSEKRNDIIYQELEVLKQKIDDIENNSVIRTDNIINSIEKSITDNLYNVINTCI